MNGIDKLHKSVRVYQHRYNQQPYTDKYKFKG